MLQGRWATQGLGVSMLIGVLMFVVICHGADYREHCGSLEGNRWGWGFEWIDQVVNIMLLNWITCIAKTTGRVGGQG